MITSLYAGLLAILYMKMSVDTIKQRRKHQVSMGIGKNREIEQHVSAHANFASYVFILIFLLYLLEISLVIPGFVLHILGLCIFLGRLLHYIAFSSGQMNFKFRKFGMHLTLWPLFAMGLANVIVFTIKQWP